MSFAFRPFSAGLAAAVAAIPLLAAPAAAQTEFCFPVPVNTVGVNVRAGQVDERVAAVTNARLCVVQDSSTTTFGTARVELYNDCGWPCFIVTGGEEEYRSSYYAGIVLRYDADGVPTDKWLFDWPVEVGVDRMDPPVCVSAGDPTPPCPEGTLAFFVAL